MFGRTLPALLLGLAVFASPSVAPGIGPEGPVLGPWPDYGPHWGMATHVELDGISEALAPALVKTLGENLVIEDDTPLPFAFDAGHLIWMRDFAPVYVRSSEGLVMWEPLVERAIRRAFHGRSTPAAVGARTRDGTPLVKTRRLPIVLEGGNLVTTGRWAFLTDAVYADNGRELDAEEEEDELLAQAGYVARSDAEVHTILADTLQLPPERVVVLPQMPGEATGHVDLFVLALGPDTVMVPQMEREVVAMVEEEGLDDVAWQSSEHLDNVARTLRGLGLTVRRWPMLPPILMANVDDDDDEATSTVFLSPANAVLYNGPAGRHALVPSFSAIHLDHRIMQHMLRAYETTWHEALRRLGYQLAPVDAEELAPYLGLIRCVTAPLPLAPQVTQRL